MKAFVVDTNVPIVANGQNDPEDIRKPSVNARLSAINFLASLLSSGKVMLDLAGEIQNEYRRYLSPKGQPGVGDLFYLTILQSAPTRVERHQILKGENGEFTDLPQEVIDAGFDPSDRKFAALSKKLNVPVANAIDTDWLEHKDTLQKSGIKVLFVCGSDVARWWID